MLHWLNLCQRWTHCRGVTVLTPCLNQFLFTSLPLFVPLPLPSSSHLSSSPCSSPSLSSPLTPSSLCLCTLLTCSCYRCLFWALCTSVSSQSNPCRPIKLIPLALRLPIEGIQGRVPLHPLSMGQAQWAGIVHRLGPGLGLTPALNTLHPTVPAPSPSLSCTQTPTAMQHQGLAQPSLGKL